MQCFLHLNSVKKLSLIASSGITVDEEPLVRPMNFLVRRHQDRVVVRGVGKRLAVPIGHDAAERQKANVALKIAVSRVSDFVHETTWVISPVSGHYCGKGERG
jgi:hypothetical protein